MSTPIDKIVVLDFGSQYAHLIAKRFRRMGFYSTIALPSAPLAAFDGARGVVLSGGPASVYDEGAPTVDEAVFSLGVPLLGLCYGHYVVQTHAGAQTRRAARAEFGLARFHPCGSECPLFRGVDFGAEGLQVWMSHSDEVVRPGEGFECVGYTKDCALAAAQNLARRQFSLQFHCEVKDTPSGDQILANFARLCGMEQDWGEDEQLERISVTIKRQAEGKKVLLFLSGGVDSSVSFALLNRALGQERVLGLHIDNGFMRKGESSRVCAAYKRAGFDNFKAVDESERFLAAVAGLVDPQEKRRAVGETFVAVRDEFAEKQGLGDEWLLAQGTLYPDIIESGGTKNADAIKTHHNRVAGIQRLIAEGKVIEPLADLYKDEVRVIGRKLGLEESLVGRHPFPGPGLSINVLCSDGQLSEGDEGELSCAKREIEAMSPRVLPALGAAGAFVLPVKSVGVQGDARTYRFPCALHFGEEGAGYFALPGSWDDVERASGEITGAARYISRTTVLLWRNPAAGKLALQRAFCTRDRLDQTREADAVAMDTLKATLWHDRVFQHLTINLPLASSADRCSIVLRPVCSEDVMTARFAHLPREVLCAMTRQIAELGFVDAIFFDATNKPPATFGWE